MILCIDGYNFIHRARGGFNLGEYSVCFNFFRGLRAIVDQFKPSRVYFVVEGVPVKRLQEHSTYKANRKIEALSTDEAKKLQESDPVAYKKAIDKAAEMKSFYRQKDLIIDLLKTSFPVSVMRHPEHEADDVIYNVVKKSSSAVPWTIVSNDSDFTQILNELNHVSIYNPMLKEFVQKPDYDYVDWKSFRGDGSDNILGVPGVGDKTAVKLVTDLEFRKEFLKNNPDAQRVRDSNYQLIKFFDFNDQELINIESSTPERDWSIVKDKFEQWGFNSLLKEKTWDKYVSTFDDLFGVTS